MTRRPRAAIGSVLVLAGVLLGAGCYASHAPLEPSPDAGSAPGVDARVPGCRATPPRCVSRPDPCGAPVLVPPECDLGREVWICPAPSVVYVPPAPSADVCLPFHDGSVAALENGGMALPVGERCLYVAIGADLDDGTHLDHPGFWMTGDTACPSGAEPLGHDAFDRGSLAPLDAPHDAVRLADGETAAFARLYVWEPGEVFGVRGIGTVIALWDARAERLVARDALTWLGPPDFGEAAFVDAGFVYAYSCTGPRDFLTYGCFVARTSAGSTTELADERTWEYFTGPTGWVNARPSASVIAYGGPERSAIRRVGDGFVWVRIVGFGSTLELARAPAPEGPWSAFTEVARCELPAGDTEAFCRDPLIHLELSDPLDPTLLSVQYSIATLAPDFAARRRASPDAYWPRIVHVRL